MTQHYRSHGTSDTAVCGQDMVGRRNTSQLLFDDNTTCIKCRAVVTGRWLYVALCVDEDGFLDANYFNSVVDQLQCGDEAEKNGAVTILYYIVTAEEIPSHDPYDRLAKAYAAAMS